MPEEKILEIEQMMHTRDRSIAAESWAEQVSQAIASMVATGQYLRDRVCTETVELLLGQVRAVCVQPDAPLSSQAYFARTLQRVHAERSVCYGINQESDRILAELRSLTAQLRLCAHWAVGERECEHRRARGACRSCIQADESVVRASFAKALANTQRAALGEDEWELADNLVDELLELERSESFVPGDLFNVVTGALLDAVVDAADGGREIPEHLLNELAHRWSDGDEAYDAAAYGAALTSARTSADPSNAVLRALFECVLRELTPTFDEPPRTG